MNLQRKTFLFGKIQLSYLDNENNSAEETILITHANGFSAECYSYIIKEFSEKFRILALDFCGHGKSEPTMNFKNWLFFRDQIISLIEHEKIEKLIGIGHSMGGASFLMTAKLLKDKIQKLILFDPTILSVPKLLLGSIFGVPIAENARKRRKEFQNLEIVRKTYRRFPIFKRWDDEIFEDYLRSCFQENSSGKVELVCDPELEAKIFSSVSIFSPLKYVFISTESHIIIPRNYGVCSPAAAKRIISGNKNSSLTLMPGFTHLFPFEEKTWVLSKLHKSLE
ncbi:MAG: alpha/beta hydrolase [Leptospiraceae bacterium]|nr:alpha/beta hydrolase [Leptospiraceae bacterium]